MATATVSVQVEITWGREWNGSHMALTPGKGCYVTVSEIACGGSFRGCPLGRGISVEEAIADFIRRGGEEYKGTGPLSRKMVVVTTTKDYRK